MSRSGDDEDNWHAGSESEGPMTRQKPTRKSAKAFNSKVTKTSPMETLDRRISASSDNLDSLRRERRKKRPQPDYNRARSVSKNQIELPPGNFEFDPEVDEVEQRMFPAIKVNENDRTKYVSELRMKKSVMSEKSECASSVMKSVFLGIKTPFSEKASGEGPYSRRLYGPPPPRLSTEEIERHEAICHGRHDCGPTDDALFGHGSCSMTSLFKFLETVER